MKKLITIGGICLFIGLCGSSHAQTLAQTPCEATYIGGFVSTISCTFASNVSINNKLYVHTVFGSAIAGISASDTLGLSWTCVGGNGALSLNGINARERVCYADTGSSSGADTVTLNASGSDFMWFVALEYVGVGAYDIDAQTQQNGSTTTTSQAITTTLTTDVAILACVWGGATPVGSLTPSGAETQRFVDLNASSFFAVTIEDQPVTPAGAYSLGCTSGTNSNKWATHIAAFGFSSTSVGIRHRAQVY